MFRFSQSYFQHKQAQEAIEQTRQAIERERRTARRWRQKRPERNPANFLKAWDKVKKETSKKYVNAMIRTMALFDGVSEANKMMRYGLEASDAGIDLETFHDLIFNTFNLHMFEMVAEHYQLSQVTREMVLKQLVETVFKRPIQKRPRVPFEAAVVENTSEGTYRTREYTQ